MIPHAIELAVHVLPCLARAARSSAGPTDGQNSPKTLSHIPIMGYGRGEHEVDGSEGRSSRSRASRHTSVCRVSVMGAANQAPKPGDGRTRYVGWCPVWREDTVAKQSPELDRMISGYTGPASPPRRPRRTSRRL